MNIQEVFKNQLATAEPITEEKIQELLKKLETVDFPLKTEEEIRKRYPIGDKRIFAFVRYPRRGVVELMSLLESELDTFEKSHKFSHFTKVIETPYFIKTVGLPKIL